MRSRTTSGWQARIVLVHKFRRWLLTAAVVAAAFDVVLTVGLVGPDVVFPGRYSGISHPCELLSQATVSALVTKSEPPWERPGAHASCHWAGLESMVLLDLYTNDSALYISAQSQSRKLYKALLQGPSTNRSIPGIGDEAVLQQGVLLVRTDNLVWSLAVIGADPRANDAVFKAAQEIQTNLRNL